MSDLINRNALILYLNDWALSVSGNDKEYEDVQAFIKCVEEWPLVNQWIKCSDRLPDKKGYYLVTRKNPKGHVTRTRFNPEQVERGVYNSPWGNGDCDILAWMPLPQPYKAESEENK